MDSALGLQLTTAPKAPLQILHLLSSGGFYGLERMLLDHCLHTPGQHQVLLIEGPESLANRFVAAGVALERCPTRKSLWRKLQSTPEPLLINGHGFKGLVLGWLAALRFGVPLITTQHGFTLRNRKQRLYAWLSLQLCRLPQVRAVACVADSIARLYQQAGVAQHKLHVLPNGLPPASEQTARRAEGAPPSPLIGFVGRLSWEKGPDLFLELAIELCRRHPQLSAVMLGDGPLRGELSARIDAAGLQGRIQLPGYQPRMDDWLRSLDVLVLSSRTEGTPMVILEAMQSGTAIAAFSVGGIPDMLSDEQSALLSPAENLAVLVHHVDRLLREPSLRRQLSGQARQVQLSRYHLPLQVERWCQLYRRSAGV
jgi:glycosyltransferase involved in cell wall biosynthesis